MSEHSRQPSFASSFVSTSANNSYSTNSSSTPRKKTPVKIGPWKLGKTLGRGANGRVFLATNINTRQRAAVKVVSKATLNESKIEENEQDEQDCDSAGLSYGIEREIIIMKLLNHKNVLRLYDVWETEKALYLVLEYVEGGELFDLLIESGPLPEKTAVDFFKQIIMGASYCHNLGICHRDLKPENILLDSDLNVKIADFGMAALESGRLLETSCGSPHYAAPEIISGLQYHGDESDVWSCGVILFALLTGRLPFDDDNTRDLLLKVQVGKYEIVENLSKEAVDLIDKMLTVDPEKRIKTKEILKHPLIRKYYNCDEDKDFNQLPPPESAICPVKSRDEIDARILENLVILWHGRPAESIIESLLAPESNSEKTFYSLLLRYRHEHSNPNLVGNSKNQQLRENGDDFVRSSSIISKTTESPLSHSSSRSDKSKNRRSITASTSSNRPIVFSNKRRSRSSMISTAYALPAVSPHSSNNSSPESYLKNKRNSTTPTNYNPMLHNTPKRQSLIPTDSTPTKRKSLIASDISNLNRQSVSTLAKNSKSKIKRNSVTSKVLSTYAMMANYEKTKKSVDDYGKRTSADFAALCDALFEDQSKSDVKIPDSESMATINAIVFGSKGNKRRSLNKSSMISPKRNSKITQATSARVKSVVNKDVGKNYKARNITNPLERISQLLNSNDINEFERRIASDIPPATLDLAEPPAPVSRLDPRYKAYETFKKRTSQHAAYLLQLQAEAEEEAKKAAEIKEREEKLRSQQEELEKLKSKLHHMDINRNTYGKHDFDEYLGHSSGTVLKKSEYYDPKQTKMRSNRYSALSIHSTKMSSKRLSFYLKEIDSEIVKNQEKSEREEPPVNMILHDEIIEEDHTPELNIPQLRDTSMNTLIEEDYDTAETEMEIHDTKDDTDLIGKARSASVSNKLDDDLCFVPALDVPVRHSSMGQPENKINPFDRKPISAVDHSLDSSKDSTFDQTQKVNQRLSKLPEIPGSPVKKVVKPVKSQATFEVFEDAIRKSKQEFDEENKEIGQNVIQAPPQQQKEDPITVEKQRQPLKQTLNANTKTKSERKSSFEKFKSLFSSHSTANPESFHTTLSEEDLFDALKGLLSGWSHYGIGNLVIDTNTYTLKGEILKKNALNVKPCKFTCIAGPSSISESKVTFFHDKGSVKSFGRIVSEFKNILANEKILVR
ncbi:hypothetical protein CANINC_002347 [Pichia inconspicua]|uniref:non-specific serine/threonine protein kinase n=1 Tax=Pichia inconspicua TaxID=52247 RepID=A0A4V4NFR0_9ASCO|nr:hypothetical protein CANINC_002347 [[Candida] inconspicua]